MDEMKKVVDKLARKQLMSILENHEDGMLPLMREILTRDLLPILEAGQAMRNETGFFTGLYEAEGKAWDAALKALLGDEHESKG
jgi:hypothetical protein